MLELRRSKERPPEALDRLLDGLSRPPVPAGKAVELTGPRELLEEATLVAIDEAGERVGAGCTSLLRREGDSGAVRVEVRAVQALLELLRAFEDGD